VENQLSPNRSLKEEGPSGPSSFVQSLLQIFVQFVVGELLGIVDRGGLEYLPHKFNVFGRYERTFFQASKSVIRHRGLRDYCATSAWRFTSASRSSRGARVFLFLSRLISFVFPNAFSDVTQPFTISVVIPPISDVLTCIL
jgi:hypothetical protein